MVNPVGRSQLILLLLCFALCIGSVLWLCSHGNSMAPTPVIRADEPDDQAVAAEACGQWCLFYVGRLVGIPVDMEQVGRILPGPGPHNFLELARSMERMGLSWEAREMDFETLCQSGMPAVCHLRPGHFATVIEATDDCVVFYDLKNERKQMTAAEFRRMWSGKALLVSRAKSGSGTAADASSIHFNSLMKDAGTVAASDGVVVFRYRFVNDGLKDIAITDVKTSCVCVEAAKPSRSIGPGEDGAIELRYRADVKPGPFRHIAIVTTTDAELPIVELVATGNVSDFIRSFPRHLTLGKLAVGKTIDRDLRIQGLPPEGAITGVSCEEASIAVDYRLLRKEDIVRETRVAERCVIGTLGDGGRVVRLRLTGKRKGMIAGGIAVQTSVKGVPALVIPFTASVCE